MSDDTATTSQSPVIEIERRRSRTTHTGTEVIYETLVLDKYQVEELLEQALRGTLDGVRPETIETELEHRAR